MLELPLVHFPCPLFCTIEKSKESAPKILTMLGNVYLRSTLSKKIFTMQGHASFPSLDYSPIQLVSEQLRSHSSSSLIRVLI